MIMTDTDLKTDIQIKGHAGYAPAGSDIVCAAVSILYETLKRMLRPGLDGTVIEDENGIRIEINPDLGTWGRVSLNYFITGIQMLEREYPKHVQLKIGRAN